MGKTENSQIIDDDIYLLFSLLSFFSIFLAFRFLSPKSSFLSISPSFFFFFFSTSALLSSAVLKLTTVSFLKFSKEFFREQENCESVQAQIEEKGKFLNFQISYLQTSYL